MSNFLRKLDDTLHIPDRIIHGIQETARGSSKEETPGGVDESSRTSDRPGEGLRQGEGGYDTRNKLSQSSGGPMDVVRSGLSELAPSVGNPMGTSGSYGDEGSRYQTREVCILPSQCRTIFSDEGILKSVISDKSVCTFFLFLRFRGTHASIP